MLDNLLKKLIGSKNDRELKRLWAKVQLINALEPQIQPLSDDDLRAKTTEFKTRLEAGATLDDILIEAFAVCREASDAGTVVVANNPTIKHDQARRRIIRSIPAPA